jgi:S-formylglutathione hydrolase FrmB
MAFCTLHHFSPALRKMTGMNIILPERITGRVPVFYLLHGLSDDYTAWHRRSAIERHAQSLPLIVVMPDGGRYWYCDGVDGPRYDSYIVGDLIPFIDSMFPTRAERAGRVLGGLSMGGYGALKLALKFPQLFVAANGHSGAYDITGRPDVSQDIPEWRHIFGDHAVGGKDDVFAIAAALDRKTAPALRIDCGVDDFLIDANRRFHAHLTALGLAHEYEEFPGAHNWPYWDTHVPEALAFHARHLGITALNDER